jgi:hypothetical protein
MHNERSLTPLTVHGSETAANCPILLFHLGTLVVSTRVSAGASPRPMVVALVASFRCGSRCPRARYQVGIVQTDLFPPRRVPPTTLEPEGREMVLSERWAQRHASVGLCMAITFGDR